MGLEVALEIQNLQLIALLEGEQLTESSISLDYLLVHELVVLGVGAYTCSHLRAAQLSALGNTEEGAESIRDGDRASEDSVLLRSIALSLAVTATTLGGLLQLTRNLLLELAHGGEDSADRSTESIHLLNEGGELSRDVDLLSSSGGSGLNWCSNNRGWCSNNRCWGRCSDYYRSRGWCGDSWGGRGGSSGCGGLLRGFLNVSCRHLIHLLGEFYT